MIATPPPDGVDPSLWRAYRRTTYRVLAEAGPIDVQVGTRSEPLDRLLDALGAARWAFVSAANPRSVRLPDDENAARHERLRGEAARVGRHVVEGVGIGADGDWPPEPSLLVVGLSPDAARALGRRFEQLAIVVGLRGGPAMLIACDPSPAGEPEPES